MKNVTVDRSDASQDGHHVGVAAPVGAEAAQVYSFLQVEARTAFGDLMADFKRYPSSSILSWSSTHARCA